MPLVPLYGHEALRQRLLDALHRGTLPASMLLHGPRGVGKQRLALWLAQVMLCESASTGAAGQASCQRCMACRAALEARHPDLHWFYPRPRLKAPDPKPADVFEDYADATAERLERHGLYAPSSGSEGIYIATIRALVQQASLAPALGKRKVFILGDAERMVSQEGADQAANAFLKLLEEPPADTTIMLTSSEPGALLPTIRSRVIAYRCGTLTEAEVRAFVNDEIVRATLDEVESLPGRAEERVALAAGAPGTLLASATLGEAMAAAREMVTAAEHSHRDRNAAALYANALSQGVSGARGAFADTLHALTVVLRERARDALTRGDAHRAYGASRAVDAVARAQACAEGNVNPQLVSARLLRELAQTLA